MAQLTQQQYDALKAKGLDDARIQAVAQSKGYTLPSAGTGGVFGVVKGAAKNVARTALDVGSLGNKIQQGVASVARGLGASVSPSAAGEVGIFNSSSPQGQSARTALESQGTAESIGSGAVNVALFFVPGAKTTQVAGRVVKGTGEVVSKAGIGISAQEAPLVQMYKAQTPLYERMSNLLKGERSALKPTLARETALKKGIAGTEGMIGVQSQRAATNLWGKVIEPALTKSPTKVNMSEFLGQVAKEVDTVTDPSRRKALQEALGALTDDFKDVGEISLTQLQKYKEGWAKFLPDKVYRGKPIAGAFKEVQNLAAQLARNTIYKELGPEVKVAYFDYGNLKNLQELGEKALTQSKLKGGAGTFISGIADMALTPIATVGGLTLYKAGQGLEFVGGVGIKTVRQLFGL